MLVPQLLMTTQIQKTNWLLYNDIVLKRLTGTFPVLFSEPGL